MASSLKLILLASVTGVAVNAHGHHHRNPEQTDAGWELRVKSSPGPTKRTCFETTAPGKGSYYIAGPAKFEGQNYQAGSSTSPEKGWKYQAVFDGLGMVNRFELRPKDHPTKMCYTSVWMNTGLRKEYEKAPEAPPRGVLFENTEPPRSRCMVDFCDYEAPNDNNWVNMIMVGKDALWFSDTPAMMTMDLENLNCTGLKMDWTDNQMFMGEPQPKWTKGLHVVTGGSAHPLTRPGTNTVVEIMIEMPMMEGNYFVDVYTFDASVQGPQGRKLLASIENDALQYFHSFGVTKNYIVLPFNLENTKIGPGHEAILTGHFHSHWKGVHILDSKGQVHVFDDMAPFWHVHIANTYETKTGITMDLAVYNDVPFNRASVMDIKTTLNKTARDAPQARGQMRRMHFNLKTKQTTIRKLTDNNKDYDFLKINPAYNGKTYCIYYAVEWYHDTKSYASMAVMKHDICSGKMKFWNQVDTYINEPFFIANAGGGEDDGTLIFTANDGRKGKAIFVTLDARTFKEIERIELPNHLPFTAHGQFVPATPDVVMV